MLFCRLMIFFSSKVFENFFQIPSVSNSLDPQIRPNISSGLIWVQTVCKSYQQTALVGEELLRVKPDVSLLLLWNLFVHKFILFLAMN